MNLSFLKAPMSLRTKDMHLPEIEISSHSRNLKDGIMDKAARNRPLVSTLTHHKQINQFCKIQGRTNHRNIKAYLPIYTHEIQGACKGGYGIRGKV